MPCWLDLSVPLVIGMPVSAPVTGTGEPCAAYPTNQVTR